MPRMGQVNENTGWVESKRVARGRHADIGTPRRDTKMAKLIRKTVG